MTPESDIATILPMANAIGRDVLLKLMTDVAEMKEDQKTATTHLEALVALSKKQEAGLDRLVRLVTVLADKLDNHEERLAALESRQ